MLLVFQEWVFHYESYHVLYLCPYHNIYILRSLLNYSIMTIILTVVLYRRLWLIIQGIVLSTSFPIMIWYFSLRLFVFRITIFWPMGDTWQLIDGLAPIVLMESSSKDDFCHVHQYFWKGLMNCYMHFHKHFWKGLINCSMHFYCFCWI